MRFIYSPSIIRAICVRVFEKGPKLPKLEVAKLATTKKLCLLKLTQMAIISRVISKHPNWENDMADNRRERFNTKAAVVGLGRHCNHSHVRVRVTSFVLLTVKWKVSGLQPGAVIETE